MAISTTVEYRFATTIVNDLPSLRPTLWDPGLNMFDAWLERSDENLS